MKPFIKQCNIKFLSYTFLTVLDVSTFTQPHIKGETMRNKVSIFSAISAYLKKKTNRRVVCWSRVFTQIQNDKSHIINAAQMLLNAIEKIVTKLEYNEHKSPICES